MSFLFTNFSYNVIFLLLLRSNCGKKIIERKISVNRKERRTEINSFIIKVLFFMTILVATAMMYMKSKSIVDIGYFCVVFVLFIKFLIVKLYHV